MKKPFAHTAYATLSRIAIGPVVLLRTYPGQLPRNEGSKSTPSTGGTWHPTSKATTRLTRRKVSMLKAPLGRALSSDGSQEAIQQPGRTWRRKAVNVADISVAQNYRNYRSVRSDHAGVKLSVPRRAVFAFQEEIGGNSESLHGPRRSRSHPRAVESSSMSHRRSNRMTWDFGVENGANLTRRRALFVFTSRAANENAGGDALLAGRFFPMIEFARPKKCPLPASPFLFPFLYWRSPSGSTRHSRMMSPSHSASFAPPGWPLSTIWTGRRNRA